MSEAAQADAGDRPGSRLIGYVEALTESAALGWAWYPGSTERVTVELRHGEQILGQSRADGMREDLAGNGIGDGRHAFALPVPEAMRSRVSELRVFAVRDGEAAIALDAPPPADPTSDRFAHLQRGLNMLVSSQRVMHRNLQSALLQQSPSLKTALADIAAAQAGLQESIATLELFAVRLETSLANREMPTQAAPARHGLLAVAAVSGLALISSGVALCRIMLG